MTTLLNSLRGSLALKAYWDLRKGSLLDQSLNPVPNPLTTITGAPTWARTARGFSGWTPSAGTNSLSPGNPASLQLTTATLFAVALRNESNAANFQGIFARMNAFGLYVNTGAEPKTFGAYDFTGAAWRASTFSSRNDGRPRLYAASFISGVAGGTVFYVDGMACGSGQVTVVNQASPWTLGWGIAAGQGLGGGVLLAGIVNRVLTPTEISALFTEWQQSGFVLDVQHRRGVKPVQKDMSDSDYARQGVFFDSDGRRLPGGLVRDLGPNGYNGTVTAGAPVPGPDGEGITLFKNDATEEINYGDTTQMNNAPALAWECDITFPASNIPVGYFMMKYTDGNNFVSPCALAAAASPKAFDLYMFNAATGRLRTNANVLRAGCRQHIMCMFNGAGATNPDKGKVMIDGEEYSCNFISNFPATAPNTAGASLMQGYNLGIPSTRNRQRWYNRVVTVGEARAIYLKNFAQKLIWQAPGEDCPVSLVASYGVANPNALGGGWVIISGTWKRSEDSQGRKWIECVTTGCVAIHQPNVFGTWVWTFAKTEVGSMFFTMIGSIAGSWNDAAQNGYVVGLDTSENLFSPFRVTGGAPVAFLCYSGNGYLPTNIYRIAINRRPSDGRFTSWVKGGTFTNWTLASAAGGGSNPTAADATHVASNWFTVTAAAGDKFLAYDPTVPGNHGHPRIYQGVLDPTKQEVF